MLKHYKKWITAWHKSAICQTLNLFCIQGPDSIESSSPKTEQDSPLEVSEPVVDIHVDSTPESVMEDASQQAVSSTTTEDAHQMEETIVVERMAEDDLVADAVAVSSPVSHTALPILQRAPVTVDRILPHRYPNRWPKLNYFVYFLSEQFGFFLITKCYT